MCERTDAIDRVAAAAEQLLEVCKARMPDAGLLRDPSTLLSLPAPKASFDELIDKLGEIE